MNDEIRISRRGLTAVEKALAALAEAVPADRDELQLKVDAMKAMRATWPVSSRLMGAFAMAMARDVNLLFDEVAAANGFLPVAPGVAPVEMAA